MGVVALERGRAVTWRDAFGIGGLVEELTRHVERARGPLPTDVLLEVGDELLEEYHDRVSIVQ